MLTWSTHALTEYFTVVSAAENETEALTGAVERAAEMVEAEVGAVVRQGKVFAPYGFGPTVPEHPLLAIAAGHSLLVVRDLGDLHAVASPLGGEDADALIVA